MRDLNAVRRTVSVFGGRHPAAGDDEYQKAFKLGSLLAIAGYSVMSGGYSGAMEAVSRGAIEAGGIAIGVTMEIFGNLSPNKYLTREIRSRDFFERLKVLTNGADGFIAIRGGMGTLTEVGLIWNMLQTGTLGRKPLILVGQFWRELLRAVSDHLVISRRDLELPLYVDSAEDAVTQLQRFHSV